MIVPMAYATTTTITATTSQKSGLGKRLMVSPLDRNAPAALDPQSWLAMFTTILS